MIRDLNDLKKGDKPKEEKNKQHFTGNLKSGQVVVDPNDDLEHIVQ